MRILRLIDINTYIYAGNVMKHAYIEGNIYQEEGCWKTEKIYTGGLAFLFNVIRDFSYNSTIIFAADRTPLARLKICPEYKAGRGSSMTREQRRELDIQKEMAEKIIQDCGFNLIYCEDWESDDVMYTARNLLLSYFDHIYIHSSDSDMYMCVLDKVSIAPVRAKDKTVTIDNYEVMAGKKNTPMRYNMCNFYKMLDGDSSDGYHGIQDYRLRERLLNTFDNNRMRAYTGESKVFGEFIQSLIPELYEQYILAYQQMVPIDFDLTKELDRDYIELWGRMVGNNGFMGREGILTPSVIQKKKEMKEYISRFLVH